MKIVVGMKAVLNPSGIAVNRRAGQVTVQREEVLMDPAAKHALEAALRLKDAL
ncbi:MAG: electron transfer flavoprotein subunit beta, partial [Chloroflexota bacterium]